MPDLGLARTRFGKDFLGPEEAALLAPRLGLRAPSGEPPPIPEACLRAAEAEPGAHLLVLGNPVQADGAPLTLLALRDRFGLDPARAEPCFYNQDWYLREPFASAPVLEARWYLLRKVVREASRGTDPEAARAGTLPSALLCAYAFFAWHLHTGGERLWDRDFVWCSDQDHQGDRIYVGRYTDPSGVNKSGFSVHRHLRIRPCYGIAEVTT